jgi:hypothetical protein
MTRLEALAPERTTDPPLPDHPPPAPPPADLTVSALLTELAESWPAERITIGDLVAAFGPRGYGLLMFVFALPNMIPAVPGISSLLGLPLAIIAWQMAVGRPIPWLPAKLARQSLSTSQLRTIANRAAPWMVRIERFLKPRPGWITTTVGERLIGVCSLILAIPVLLPGPGTNGPPSWSIGLMALGFLQRDRFTIYAGLAWGVVALAIGAAGLYAAWWITVEIFAWCWGWIAVLF